jgi:hypothetical protein
VSTPQRIDFYSLRVVFHQLHPRAKPKIALLLLLRRRRRADSHVFAEPVSAPTVAS